MIVGSDLPLVIGQRYTGLRDKDRRDHRHMPYVVLREATRDEWNARRYEVDNPERAQQAIANAPSRAWFYEVSVD